MHHARPAGGAIITAGAAVAAAAAAACSWPAAGIQHLGYVRSTRYALGSIAAFQVRRQLMGEELQVAADSSLR